MDAYLRLAKEQFGYDVEQVSTSFVNCLVNVTGLVPRPLPRFQSLAVPLNCTASDRNLGEGLGTRLGCCSQHTVVTLHFPESNPPLTRSIFLHFSQALGLLYWHKYNIEKSVEDLPNFCPLQGKVQYSPLFSFVL